MEFKSIKYELLIKCTFDDLTRINGEKMEEFLRKSAALKNCDIFYKIMLKIHMALNGRIAAQKSYALSRASIFALLGLGVLPAK